MQEPDPLPFRMRWVMLGVMAVNVLLTLVGQPAGFWKDPRMAIRFDGLPIHDPTNPAFAWFLDRGAVPFTAASLCAIGCAFLAVSRAPRKPALIFAFAATIWSYYALNNWLAVQWHVSIAGTAVPAAILGYAVSAALAPRLAVDDALVRRLTWVMALIVCLDAFNTLLGQPAGYWNDPSHVLEGNVVARWSLIHGWPVYCLYMLATICAFFGCALVLARPVGLIVIVAAIANSFVGASSWYLYVWRVGLPVIMGVAVALSIAIVAYGIYGPAAPKSPFRERRRPRIGVCD